MFLSFLDGIREQSGIEVCGYSITDTLIVCGHREESTRSSVILVHKTILYLHLKVVQLLSLEIFFQLSLCHGN